MDILDIFTWTTSAPYWAIFLKYFKNLFSLAINKAIETNLYIELSFQASTPPFPSYISV